MADVGRIVVGAGVTAAGDAAVTLDLGSAAIALDIYAAMKLVDVISAKIGEAIEWHKLAHDPDAPELLGRPAHGSA